MAGMINQRTADRRGRYGEVIGEIYKGGKFLGVIVKWEHGGEPRKHPADALVCTVAGGAILMIDDDVPWEKDPHELDG